MENKTTEKSENEVLESSETATPLSNRTSRGFRLMGIGAVILLTSCIITMNSSGSHGIFYYVLYGMTSIGASTVLYGLYCVME